MMSPAPKSQSTLFAAWLEFPRATWDGTHCSPTERAGTGTWRLSRFRLCRLTIFQSCNTPYMSLMRQMRARSGRFLASCRIRTTLLQASLTLDPGGLFAFFFLFPFFLFFFFSQKTPFLGYAC